MGNPIIEKAQTAAAAAKLEVKRIKALLKQARKMSKAAKRMVKEARRKATAETAADKRAKLAVAKPPSPPGRPAGKPLATRVPRKKLAPPVPAITVRKARATKPKHGQSMRSAADVAKSVIERLQSPPPTLPPEPIIPPAKAVLPDSGSGAGHDAGEQTPEH